MRFQTFRFCRRGMLASGLILLLLWTSAVRSDDKSTTPATPATPAKSALSLAADKFEAALKQYNFFYQRVETPGQPVYFTVGIQDAQNRSSIEHFNLTDCGWKLGDGTEVFSVHGYVQVVTQANLPAVVGQKIAEYSNSLILTGACLSSDGAYATTGFFLDHGLDPGTIYAYVINLHSTATGLKDALDPVLKGVSGEK